MIVTTRNFPARLRQVCDRRVQYQQSRADHGPVQGNVDNRPLHRATPRSARGYTHKLMLEAADDRPTRSFPDTVFAVHLDHGDEETCMDCIASGVCKLGNDRCLALSGSGRISRSPSASWTPPTPRHCGRGRVGPAQRGVEEDVSSAGHVYRSPKRPSISSSRPAATRWPLRSVPRTALSSSRRSNCALTFWRIQEASARLPAGVARLLLGAAGQVARINAASSAIKGASGVDASQFLGAAKARRDQDQHRYRRASGLVPRTAKFFVTIPSSSTCVAHGKIFMPEYAKFIAEKNVLPARLASSTPAALREE